jgi:hypothetical protein
MIYRDIKNLEQELLSTASIREKVFYNYLRNLNEIDFNDDDLSEIDNLIINIFSNNDEVALEDQIESIVRMKNRKGLDYRKSLITLVAFGLYDSNRFLEDIKSYIMTCSLRDSYLLTVVFEQIKPEYNKAASTPIDKLIYDILIHGNYELGSDQLVNAMTSVDDILDLYIVMKVYKKLGERNFQETKTFESMKSSINILNDWIGNLYIIRFLIVFWMISLPIIFTLGKFIAENWNFAEPLTYIGGLIVGIIANSFILLNKSINVKLFRDKIKSKKLRRIYKKNKLQYEDIEDIIKNN